MSKLAHSGRPANIRINIFAGAKSKVPAAQDDYEWPALCRELEALANTEPEGEFANAKDAKESLLAFTLGELSDRERSKHGEGSPETPYNLNANYVNHTALAIDVDQCAIDDARARLARHGLAALVYASASDPNPDGSRRVRIVAPVSRPVAPEEVKHCRMAFAEALGIGPGQGVETAMAVSQIMFAGRLPGTPERQVWDFDGKPLDVDALMATPLAAQWQRRAEPRAVTPIERVAVEDPDDRTALLLVELEPYWEALDEKGTGRRQILRALGGYLARRGWSDEQIAAVAQWLAPDRPVTNRVTLAVECARDARANPASAAGWNALCAWSPEAAAVIESVAKDPHEPDGFTAIWSEWWARAYEPGGWVQRKPAANGNADPDAAAFAPAVAEADSALGAPIDLSTPIQKLRYLCEGLGIAFDGKCAAVHGYAGSSKGLFLSMIALCAASGTPVFGQHAVERVPVVYGDAETGVLAEIRLKRLALALKIDLGALQRDGWFRLHRLTQSLPDSLAALETACAEIDKGAGSMLALDSYSSLVAGDENKSDYADPMWELGRMGSRVNAVPVVTMHERKSERDVKSGKPNPLEGISGTNRLAAALATSIRLTPNEDDDRVITVTCTRAPEKRFKPVSMTWTDEGAGLKAVTAAKHIPSAAETAQRKSFEKAAKAKDNTAQRVADAERLIVFHLASMPAPEGELHMRRPQSLTLKALAKAAGVHESKSGPGEAPAIVKGLVEGGWLVAEDGGRYTEYRLRDTLPERPKVTGPFSRNERVSTLLDEIDRGRTVAAVAT